MIKERKFSNQYMLNCTFKFDFTYVLVGEKGIGN